MPNEFVYHRQSAVFGTAASNGIHTFILTPTRTSTSGKGKPAHQKCAGYVLGMVILSSSDSAQTAYRMLFDLLTKLLKPAVAIHYLSADGIGSSVHVGFERFTTPTPTKFLGSNPVGVDHALLFFGKRNALIDFPFRFHQDVKIGTGYGHGLSPF